MLTAVFAATSVPACGDSGGGTGVTGVSATESPTGVSTVDPSASGSDSEGSSAASDGTDGLTGTTGAVSTSGPEPTTGGEPTSTTAITSTTSTTSTTETTSTTSTTTSPFTTGEETDTGWPETTTDGGDMCKMNIDIVFVMDVSTSMSAILQKLAAEILVVDQAIAALDVETDPNYGLVVFVDDATIINNGAPYADAAALQADFIEWSTFTQSNSQTDGNGSNGDWPENTLDGLYLGAFAFQWRPTETTLRMIIHTTDDTFGDKGANQSGEIIQHSYDETVLGLQEREIRVFSFVDNDMTGGPGNNEDVSMGFFTPYQGKTPIPQATDGGAFNINDVYGGQLSLSAAINQSVEDSLCSQYIPM
ncbi:hypothetical protein [Nannocystis punicea]|uniref:VWFA domain-containing protein n=1 Tax=Nannocystis punicea TaxID=2995304 RepID=A0ABY7HHY6_9BACT|nr:hypothetical protein [Nannocystis poenicansa]WAS98569.1 hypothetical protein O0S08_20715 [Nannocystis poenicansa]